MASILFLFAPGAGAGSSSAWMQAWARRLEALGTVRTLDYPYRLAGKRAPDPLPVLIEAHHAALLAARQSHTGPLILIGKSMGSRVGCHLSLQERVDRLVCLGYPLKSPGKSAALRDKVLLALTTPVLFVQGTRDTLCPLDELERVRARMSATSHLHSVDGGDHSLTVTKTALKQRGWSQDDSDNAVLDAIRAFVTTAAP